MVQKYRVALMIETSSSYGRQLLEGIVRFRQTHHDWSVFVEQRDLTSKPPEWLREWDGNGIISRFTTREFAETIKKIGISMVELTDRSEDFGFPVIRSNDNAIGSLASKHLISRGFSDFAFCGFEGEEWSTRREAQFQTDIEDQGHKCSIYRSKWNIDKGRSWEDEQDDLVRWLRELPKPVGIFACNDVRGQHVLDACARTNLKVPEEVAVIGVDNDSLICRLSDPPMSSIIPNPEEIGFQAATLLAKLMAGQPAERPQKLVPPIGVEARQSTDVIAISDPSIAAALSYIRENACSGATVQSVVEHCGVSRSTLERQLRRLYSRSPQQEIRHIQIKRVCQLLTDTDFPMDRIAALCGFDHPEYMHVVFRRAIGITPGQYRRNNNGDA